MNFLVVIPKFTTSPDQDYIFPVGVAYIAAALRQHGFSVQGLDLNRFAASPAEVMATVIREQSIDVVATGGISAHYDKVKAVVAGARQVKSRIVTVVGGGVMSSEPELMLDLLGVNFGVIGEGEVTMVELARELTTTRNYSSVNGIIFSAPDGRLAQTAPRGPIKDLSQLAYPDENLLQNYYQSRSRIYNLVASRSCPYKCTFCYHPIGDVYRQRELDDLFREIETSYQKYAPFHYRIIDELFSCKPQRVLEFCERIRPFHVKWDVQMRVGDVNPDLLATMREAGCVLVSYGLESGSQEVLKSMRKHTRVEEILRAVDLTYASRVQVQGAYIFGDTAETKDTVIETLSLWLKQRQVGIGLWPIEVYPGTALYQRAVENGTIPDRARYITQGCRAFNSTRMPDSDALQAMLLMYLLATTYNHVPAKTLDCRPGQLVDKGNGKSAQLFDVQVQCPHCQEVIHYADQPMYGGLKWVCRSCNRRFDMPPLSQWRQEPASFQVARNYQFQEAHGDQMRAFLNQQTWVGHRGLLPGHKEIVLLDRHYLIPAAPELDDIRFGLMQIFLVDEPRKRLDPVVIYDGNYSLLHHPYYLTHRIAALVADWRARGASVAIAGELAEAKDLFRGTNLDQAKIAGLLPLDPVETGDLELGYPVLTFDAIVKNPPQVLLVAAVRNPRETCELFSAAFSRQGVEVVALYESGTNF